MFEEIITDAAELLAKKQLGLDQKKDSDKGNLPEVLVSFRQIYENELTEQFLKVCATMKFKYEIRKLAPETLHAIAIGIKDVVEDAVNGGDTASISSIFQNRTIMEVAEKECSEQKRKENNNLRNLANEDINENEKANENKNDKLSEGKIESREQAASILGGDSEILDEASEIIHDTNKENIKEKIEELKKLYKTEDAQDEDRRETEALQYFENNGTDEERNQAQDALKNKTDRNERRNYTDKKQKETRSEVSGILFGFMKDAYNPIYSRDVDPTKWLESIKVKVISEILMDAAFSDDEKLELKEQLQNCNSIDDFTQILAQKMNELNIERGENAIDVEVLQKNAKNTVQPRIYEDIADDKQLKNRDIVLSERYAQMYFNRVDRERVSEFIKQINSNETDIDYDFEILDKIKKVDKNFYYSMIRNIGIAARENNNQDLKSKFEELIDKEVGEQLYYQNNERVIRARAEMSPEKQRETKGFITGVLHNFLIATYHTDKSVDKLKSELELFIQQDNGLQGNEKNEFINKIRQIESIDAYRDVIFEKMNDLVVEKNKAPLNKEQAFNAAKKFAKPAELQKAQARAKIVFDEGLYNAYLEFQNDLIKGREDGEYNLELIYMLKQRQDTEPYIYETIMKHMKLIATSRNDKNLMRIYESFQTSDKTDMDFEQEQQDEDKRKLEERNQKIEIAKLKRKEERKGLTEEELSEARKREPILLFEMLTEICEEKNEQNFEVLKEKIYDFMGNQIAFSETEIEKLLIDVDNSINNRQLEKIFANKISELSAERGIAQKLRDPNKFIKRAQMRTRTSNYRSVETEFKGHDSIPSRVYAVMFCDEKDRKEIFKLVENLMADNPKPPFDLSILEKIEKIDSSFYRSMIRNVGIAAQRSNNPELKEIFNTLVANEEAKQIGEDTSDLEMANIKAQIVFDECLYNRYNITSMDIVQGSPDGIYDIELIEMTRQRNTEIYEVLMANMERLSRQRDDKNLRTVYDMFRKKDEKEKEQTQEHNDIPKEIKTEAETDSQLKVSKIEVGKIFVAPEVSEIVVNHTTSERLVHGEKDQTDDDAIGLG